MNSDDENKQLLKISKQMFEVTLWYNITHIGHNFHMSYEECCGLVLSQIHKYNKELSLKKKIDFVVKKRTKLFTQIPDECIDHIYEYTSFCVPKYIMDGIIQQWFYGLQRMLEDIKQENKKLYNIDISNRGFNTNTMQLMKEYKECDEYLDELHQRFRNVMFSSRSWIF